MEKYKKVTLRVHTGSSIRNQGQAYPDAITALCEPLRNSLKVGADHITVELYPDCIIIRDKGGLGMVPFMFPDDEKIVNAYFERGIDLEELAKKLTFPSVHSLQWLAQCIALSSNYVTNEPGGLKGVGNIAYMNYADEQIVVSRPRLDLAKMYWGTDTRDEKEIPAFVFIPPTLTEIDANKLTGVIIATDKLEEPEFKNLKTSLGSAAQITGCGTKTTIRKLRIEVLKSLHPKLVLDRFAKEFSAELGAGVQIEVVDHVTPKVLKDRRTYPNGELIKVEKPTRRMLPFIGEIGETVKGEKFKIELYHSPGAKDTSPELRRFKIAELAHLPEFKHYPWTVLTGEVWFPQFDTRRERNLWPLAKNYPNPDTPERARWINAVLKYESRILEHLAGEQKRAEGRLTKKWEAALGTAVSTAVREFDFIADQTVYAPQKPPREKGITAGGATTYRSPKTYRAVRGNVMNEHGDGVVGIRIEIWKGNELVASAQTGRSGHAYFDQPKDGRYVMKIVVPKEFILVGDSGQPFIIHKEMRPGFEGIFHLITHEPPLKKSKMSEVRIQLSFRAWADQDDPWDHLLRKEENLAVIYINTEAKEMREALDAEDWDRVEFLLSVYPAAALCDAFLLTTDIKKILNIHDELSDSIRFHLHRELVADLRKLAKQAR